MTTRELADEIARAAIAIACAEPYTIIWMHPAVHEWERRWAGHATMLMDAKTYA